jgi:hypothetical protein
VAAASAVEMMHGVRHKFAAIFPLRWKPLKPYIDHVTEEYITPWIGSRNIIVSNGSNSPLEGHIELPEVSTRVPLTSSEGLPDSSRHAQAMDLEDVPPSPEILSQKKWARTDRAHSHDPSALDRFVLYPCRLFWRFFPDMVAVSFVILQTNLGNLNTNDLKLVDKNIGDFLCWVGMQTTALGFVVVSVLQRGDDRINLSRLLLESWPMNFIGYISYPLYLFQRVALSSYLDLFLGYHITFEIQPWYTKGGAMIVLMIICWLIQVITVQLYDVFIDV